MTLDFVDMRHLDREDDILERLVFVKSSLYHGAGCPEHHNSCQDYPLSPKTPTPDFVDRGLLDREDDILE